MPEDHELPDELQGKIRALLGAPEPQQARSLDTLLQEYPAQQAEIVSRLQSMGPLSDRLRALCALHTPAPAAPPVEVEDRIGPYEILGVLGEGGMGVVYLAQQHEPVRRKVAVKVIKLGMDSEAVLRRFESERQALAVMSHDHIAKVLDAGATSRGQPFFVMEYLPGTPLVEYCDGNQLDLEQRIRLFEDVCAGVQHAHQKGVIHRDLKPGNILVTEQNGEPVVKIIDFGLARATERTSLLATLQTAHGHIVGTPEYMSPEQAVLDGTDLDTRTDIYSLGVVLYELLTGCRPFSSDHLRETDLLEMLRRVRESEPPRPSSRVLQSETAVQAAVNRRTTRAALARLLGADLDWIVLKAIEKDRARRYESADALALDLARYRADEPVMARPPSATYRISKFVRRHRIEVLAGGLVLVALVAGVVGTSFGLWRAERKAYEVAQQKARGDAWLAKFNLLELSARLETAREEAESLLPAWPEQLADIAAWTHRQEILRAKMPAVRSAVLALEEGSAEGEGDEALRRGAFLLGELQKLEVELATFFDQETGTFEEVQQRRVWAEQIARASVENHRDRWQRARSAIATADGVVASELYATVPIDLVPQIGLVPIGMNPATQLWEFYHLRSAWDPASGLDAMRLPIPEHGDDGSIAVDGEFGIVFVLVPGGSFTMGAQNADPDGSNYSPDAESDEIPLQDVRMDPFFMARHEVTRGQWKRLARDSSFAEKPALPRVQVSRPHCTELLAPHGLQLPTEAQWEFACGAGTTTPWSSGREAESLRGYANLADAAFVAEHGAGRHQGESWTDHFADYSPVGAMKPNPWGLHDMHGNVAEWCRDDFLPYEVPARPGDGLREGVGRDGVYRGGGWATRPDHMRKTRRFGAGSEHLHVLLGLRAARRLVSP